MPRCRPPDIAATLPPHRHHIAATLLPHCRHIAATLPPYCRHIDCHNCHKTLFLNKVLFGPKHDLIGRNKVLWQLWQPMWRQYGGNVAAMWRQCGSSVAAMWWRCGGDVAAMSGGDVAATWHRPHVVAMLLSGRRHVVIVSSRCWRLFIAMLLLLRRHVVTMSWPCRRHLVVMVWLLRCLQLHYQSLLGPR